MSGPARFVFGGIIVTIGLLALWGAAAAKTGMLYWAGLAVFAATVAYVMNMVRHAFDEAERSRSH